MSDGIDYHCDHFLPQLCCPSSTLLQLLDDWSACQKTLTIDGVPFSAMLKSHKLHIPHNTTPSGRQQCFEAILATAFSWDSLPKAEDRQRLYALHTPILPSAWTHALSIRLQHRGYTLHTQWQRQVALQAKEKNRIEVTVSAALLGRIDYTVLEEDDDMGTKPNRLISFTMPNPNQALIQAQQQGTLILDADQPLLSQPLVVSAQLHLPALRRPFLTPTPVEQIDACLNRPEDELGSTETLLKAARAYYLGEMDALSLNQALMNQGKYPANFKNSTTYACLKAVLQERPTPGCTLE